MTKLKGLLLTEGMHGMISQVEGLAKALNLEFIHEKIELNNFWKMIPPKLTPVKDFVFKNNISEKFISKALAKPSTWLIIPCIPSVNNIPFNLVINHYIAFI